MNGVRRKRVLILVAGVLALAGMAGGGYLWRQGQLDDRALAARDRGLAAYDAEDYETALHSIGRYINRFGITEQSADLWWRYGRARLEVENEDGSHVAAAQRAIARAHELDPSNLEYGLGLIELHTALGDREQALEVSRQLQHTHPGHYDLMWIELDIHRRRRKFREALTVARRIHDHFPDRLEASFGLLNLMVEVGTDATEIRSWAEEHVARAPRDARRSLLLSAALAAIGDRNGSQAALETALASDESDPTFGRMLVHQLDLQARFDDALAYLERTSFEELAPELRRELVQRLWFARRLEDVVSRLEALDVADANADSQLLVFRLLAQRELGRRIESAPLLERLKADEATSEEQAWATYLERVELDDTDDPARKLDGCLAARDLDPDNVFILHALGDAYLRMGEHDMALETWADVAVRERAWSRPLTRTARVYLSSGRQKMALELAQAGLLRSPTDLAAIGAWVRAAASNLDALDENRRKALFDLVSRVQTRIPGEAETLDIYVRMLAEDSSGAAYQHVTRVLAVEPPIAAPVLVRLFTTCREMGVGAGDLVADRCRDLYGPQPEMSLALALDMARGGNVDKGRGILQTDARGTPPEARRDWDLAEVRFLDHVGDDEAASAWAALCDARADDVRIQVAALDSAGIWTDRDAVARVIERAERLSGSSSMLWRVAKARWLLEDPTGGEKAAGEATSLLTEVVAATPRAYRPRLLLASALARLGNPDGAAEHLRAAASVLPDAGPVLLELARLAQDRGDLVVATSRIEQYLGGRTFAPRDVRTALEILDRQRDVRGASALLDRVASVRKLTAEEQRAQALAWALLGEGDRAEAQLRRIVEREESVPNLALLARVLGLRGKRAEAAELLDRLDRISPDPVERLLARGAYESSLGAPEKAVAAYRAALEADPEHVDAARGLLRALAALNRVDEFSAELAARAALLPDLAPHTAALERMLADARVRALVLVVLDAPASFAVIDQAAEAVLEDADPRRPSDTAVQAATQAAEKLSRVLPLQTLLVELHAARGDHDAALNVAGRAIKAFPVSPEPARLRARVLAVTGEWEAALAAARAWRDRSGTRHSDVDTFLAECHLRLGNDAEGLAEIAPYLEVAKDQPERFERLLLTYVWGLLRTGRVDEALALVDPLLKGTDRWEDITLGYEVHQLPDADVAVRWLTALESRLPSDDLTVALRLAVRWQRVARDQKAAGARKRLAALIDRVRGHADVLAQDHFTCGLLLHELGETAGATAAYERALAADGSLHDARNNLAVVATETGNWKRGVELARAAVEAAPDNPDYLDTLSAAYAAGGRTDDAVASLQKARSARPSELRWDLALAELLLSSDRTEAARGVLSEIHGKIRDGVALETDLRERFRTLETRLGSR